jgi:putative endonuclease
MYVIYALHSKKFDKIYIGYTTNLIDRFHSHNTLSSKGFTVKFRPWEVAYVEFVETKKEAMKREQQIKTSAGRRFIREHVELIGLISVS